MDWITTAAIKGNEAAKARARKPKTTRQLGLPHDEAIRIPAVSGQNVRVTRPKADTLAVKRTRRPPAPCIAYKADGTIEVLTRKGKPRSTRQASHATQVAQSRLSLLYKAGTIGNVE